MEKLSRLNKIKTGIILEYPFFGYLLTHLQLKEDNNIKSISCDGKYIYYNNEFIEKTKDKEIEFLLIHEIIHIILFHIQRRSNKPKKEAFDRAADLVTNAIIKNECRELSQDLSFDYMIEDKEASNYTVEQVYDILLSNNTIKVDKSFDPNDDEGKDKENDKPNDDHSKWENEGKKSEYEKNKYKFKWVEYAKDAIEYCKGIGMGVSKQLLNIFDVSSNQVDWKTVLSEFIEEEICDYSFNSPDKRYLGYDLIMPSYSEVDYKLTNILFFIDTSGSMTEDQISVCRKEVLNCIKQYNGKVEGYIGYFDYVVSDIVKFENEKDVIDTDVLGGGGTSFKNIFSKIDEYNEFTNKEKCKIIILTDGYAEFPTKKEIKDRELLWIINNNHATPPIGKIIRIK